MFNYLFISIEFRLTFICSLILITIMFSMFGLVFGFVLVFLRFWNFSETRENIISYIKFVKSTHFTLFTTLFLVVFPNLEVKHHIPECSINSSSRHSKLLSHVLG